MMLTLTKLITKKNIDSVFNELKSQLGKELNFVWLGRQKYQPVWDLQKKIHSARIDNQIGDTVLFVEHYPVYTLGKNGGKENILDTAPKDAEIVQIDRGGDVTYHGPEQLVGYPIIHLKQREIGVADFVKSTEQIIIKTLEKFNIKSIVKDGLPGVWVGNDKIGAIGYRLSQWVSMHGFALNLNPDMKYFNGIVPCGNFGYGVTSIKQQIETTITLKTLAEEMEKSFITVFNR
ncbi:MAG: lipoyl(octanoyl) transferase LipB [Candidatus Marinimicrobia bacterium]|nr:lipoyl(octanoyl) transferase LipB [Candidatus Neomarinimicrobiota bacterium]MBL7023778.1 lipoyl(octanoyl) transferase LipB [Candidatus Neomarinimicrobiota bacterium]MBL7110103.1 lipoyl(octanoyl) transferase LipB [Candidatus Neomarinimicrobiota bacterium]